MIMIMVSLRSLACDHVLCAYVWEVMHLIVICYTGQHLNIRTVECAGSDIERLLLPKVDLQTEASHDNQELTPSNKSGITLPLCT